MKNNIQRIIVMVAVVSLLVCFLVFPASAAVDYNDLITNIEVDGDKDIVTISVPADNFKFDLYCADTGSTTSFSGSSFSAHLDALSYYSIYVYAFGMESLDITNIPDGAQVTFDFSVSSNGFSSYSTPTWYTQIYYQKGGKYIGQNSLRHDNAALFENLIFEMSMDKVDGAQTATFNIVCQDLYPWNPYDFEFTVNSLQLTFSISSLYRLQEQTGKTNEILSAVEKKLEENGQKLDDVINGTPEQNEQIDNAVDEMQGAVDRLEQAGEAMNSIERPDMSDIDISIDSFVPQTSLLAYTSPILTFWENDTLLAMVTIVCTLVLVSWVFFGKKG